MGEDLKRKRRSQPKESIAETPPKHARMPQERRKLSQPRPARPAPQPLVEIDAAVLKEASGLGLDAGLRSLLSRNDVVAKDLPQDKVLRALRACGGQVTKARNTLLSA